MNERDVFIAALQMHDAAERAAFLDEACAGNADLRAQLDALLREHQHLGSFLETPAAPPDTPAAEPVNRDGVGSTIGPYKLLQQIGEGGMGTVFMAEQEQPIRRRVALKIIKLGMDSAQVVARFEAERQALALMDHQNIARVLDGGTTESGRPYFVMELVKGVTITDYCDTNHLTPRERLELFVPVCQAIQHAHQKGIIHRDIKPSNVMVTMQDGQPVPKVIDFGVAKAIDQRLTERTLFTAYGQVVGTLEYMSPEQAEMSGLDVDTRSDIYSLGVLAYELLTGTTPLQRKTFRSAAFGEILRLIREEEPPKPSARLSDSGDGLATISAQRQMEPAKLTRLVRGELDWIVMKALEKDRGRRYESASDLARDIQCYLADETVAARPATTAYRLGKFLRRHKGPVLAVATVLLVLVGGIVGTTWGLLRADQAWQAEAGQRHLAETREAEAVAAADQERQARTREAQQRQRAEANEKKAVAEKQIAEAVRTFLLHDLLSQANPTVQANDVRQLGGGFEAVENPTIKELLDRAAAELTPAKIEAKFPDQKEVQASILRTVGDTYDGIGDFNKAAEFFARASDLYRAAVGADDQATLSTLNCLACAYLSAGNLPPAIKLFEELRVAVADKFGANDPGALVVRGKLARAYQDDGKLAQAIALFEEVHAAQVKELGADDEQTISTLHDLGAAYSADRKLPEAIAILERVRDARTKQLGAEHPSTLMTMSELAVAYNRAGKGTQAIELLEEVRVLSVKKLGATHPHTITVLHDLARAYQGAGKLPQAIELYEQVRDARVKKLGADHPASLKAMSYLAIGYNAARKYAEAGALFQQVLDIRIKKLGPDHPDTINTQHNLAFTYYSAGKLTQAIELYEQVLDARIKKLGPDHPDALNTQNGLAHAYQHGGKLPEAIELFERMRDAQMKALGPEHPNTLSTLNNLAKAYQDAGKPEKALPLFQQTASEVEKQQFQHPQAGLIVANVSACQEQLQQYAEAESWRRKWLAVVKARAGSDSPAYADELVALGANLLKQEKWTAAEGVLRECLALREKLSKVPVTNVPGVLPWQVASVKSLLGAALASQKNYVEAEPLLVAGAAGLLENEKTVPPTAQSNIADALQRVVALYEATAKKNDAEKWRKRLAERNKAKPPTGP